MDFRVLKGENFKHFSWHGPSDFGFAQACHLIPLYGPEVQLASAAMPLAVIPSRFGWELVAVCGLHPYQNHFIHNGYWDGSYQPIWLSHYPFMAGEDIDGQTCILFDVSSGLLDEQGGGHPFYSPNISTVGKTSKRVEEMRPFITYRNEARELLAILANADGLIPWPGDMQRQFEMNIPNLYMIDTFMARNLGSESPVMRNAEPLAEMIQQSLDQVPSLADRANRQYF